MQINERFFFEKCRIPCDLINKRSEIKRSETALNAEEMNEEDAELTSRERDEE